MNFATIGSNKIVKNFLAAAKTVQGFHYMMSYSRSLETAEKMKKEYGAEMAVDKLSLIADSKEVDAVYIASPNSCHFTQAKMMLEAGKHVLCEKPVCTNLRQYRYLRKLAESKGLLFFEALRHIHDPGASKIKENLTKLGQLRYGDIHYMQYSSRYDRLKAGTVENAFKKELSNGALMDIGIYCTSLAAYLFGEPQEIKSMGKELYTGVDGEGCALLSYESGFIVRLAWSKICDDLSPSRIIGEEGSMLIDSIANPKRVEILYRDEKKETIFEGGTFRDNDGNSENNISSQFDNNMAYEITDFIKGAEALSGSINRKDVEGEPRDFSEVSFISMKTADAIRREQKLFFPDDRISGKILLISDYDGTFCFGESEPPCRKNYESIDRFRRAGNIFAFASGRQWGEFSEKPDSYDYYIGLNGALIKDNRGRTLHKSPIREDAGRIIGKLKAEGARNIRVYTEEKAYFDYETKTDDDFINCFLSTRHFEDIRDLDPSESICMLSVSDESEERLTALLKRLSDSGLKCSFLRNKNFIDITAEGVGKEKAVTELSELCCIDRENIFTAGDSGNDMGMVREFNGYTPYSGESELKRASLGSFNELSELSDALISLAPQA